MRNDHITAILKAINNKNPDDIRNIMTERGLDVTDEWAGSLIDVQRVLTGHLSGEKFISALLTAPDEQDALEFVRIYLQQNEQPRYDLLPEIIQLSGTSPLLARYLTEYNDLPEEPPASEQEYLKLLESISYDENFPAKLRQFKNKMIAFIAMRDISGAADFQRTLNCISSLATAILKYALKAVSAVMKMDMTTGFTIIGMGKLGAGELNYSSDIDIIYTASDQLYEQRGVREITKFAEHLTSVLSMQMSDGIVYRTDLDLRPDGRQGILVPSLTRMLTYYESWGETWERLALIKATYCAGDKKLADAFFEDIQRFVYRRYLDFSTIDALKDIKHRIKLSLMRSREQTWDVKLGDGGIRELEFSVQVMQLIRGGKEKGLRVKSTIEAIYALSDYGILKKNEVRKLINVYILLRTLEHRIQQHQMLQSHKMPADKRGERRVLRGILLPEERISPDAHKKASAKLSQARGIIHSFFQQLFYKQERMIEARRPDNIVKLFLSDTPDAEIEQRLLKMGFRDKNRVFEYMRFLREGIPNAHYSEKTKRIFNWLAPVFLKEASETIDPDVSLEHLVEFMKRIGARGIFFSLLKENPKTLSTLMQFFSMSDYLSHLLIAYPKYLDSLVLARYATLERSYQSMYDELLDTYSQLTDYEDKLRLVREFKIKETLRIAINDINEDLNIVEVSQQLSSLADAIISITLKFVIEELEPAYGTLPDIEKNGIAVIGMGKLGSRELNYNSDLDLVFIYDNNRQTTKQVSAQEYFLKVVQKFITAISISTESGYAYNIDTRLRPSGNMGPLVANINSFIQYHKESSMLWEKQALLKARGIVGHPELLNRLFTAIRDILASVKKDESLMKETHDIRMRLEKSVRNDTANFNFKKGKGGLMDIEFIIQYLELLHIGEDPSMYEKNTFLALEILMQKGYISKKDMDKLKDGYIFLRKLENRIRIDKDFSIEKISMNEEDIYPIALRMRYKGKNAGKEFSNALTNKVSNIRQVYNTYLHG